MKDPNNPCIFCKIKKEELSSMINEANCGFFIQSNNEDQLKLMIDDLAHRETCELSEIGKKGTKWIIDNRKWDTIAENYINLF